MYGSSKTISGFATPLSGFTTQVKTVKENLFKNNIRSS